jgi:putative transcriptional regulator
MLCDYCKTDLIVRRTTEALPYMYRESGLSNVALIGITVRKCKRCNVEMPVIPHIEDLHNVIALDIVNQTAPLSGEEIRFLRKYAGFPAQKFAHLLGVTPEHLSRVENGHESKFGGPADRLVRAFAVIARKTEHARETLLTIADKLAKQKHTQRQRQPEQLTFKLNRSGDWANAA